MKRNEIPERLAALRQFLNEENIDAFIVPSTDAHLSEYPPKFWESRKWISGFTGSAGTAVITKNRRFKEFKSNNGNEAFYIFTYI